MAGNTPAMPQWPECNRAGRGNSLGKASARSPAAGFKSTRHLLRLFMPATIDFMNYASYYFYFFGFPKPLAEERKRRI